MRKARFIMLLLLLLCFSSKGAAVDALPQTGTAPASNHMALAAEAKAAAQAGQLKGESALSYQLRTMPGQTQVTFFSSSSEQREVAMWGLVCAGLIILACLVVVRSLAGKLHSWAPVASKPDDGEAVILAENKDFSKFVSSFHQGPAASEVQQPTKAVKEESSSQEQKPKPADAEPRPEAAAKTEAKPGTDPGAATYEMARNYLQEAHRILGNIEPGRGDGARHKLLLELMHAVGNLKESAGGQPSLLPVWQLASALEGLLKQLSERAREVTSSALRTAGNALDLLEQVCVRGVRTDLVTEPAVRVLAVDDDVISRQAVSTALKKVFGAPDLAADGAAGLSLATAHAYDVVFLDVEMPGMDGFELCSKIHETVSNQNTPVVFVTSHNDFDSRAKSALSGGQDFMAKPFLAFELALKALTLVASNRLGAKKTEGPLATKVGAATGSCGTTLALTTRTPAAYEKSNIIQFAPAREPVKESSGRPEKNVKIEQSGGADKAASGKGAEKEVVAAGPAEGSGDFAETFFKKALASLEILRKLLNLLKASETEVARQEGLGALYVSVHTLTEEAGSAKLDSMQRLGLGLENMFKKLLEKPNQITASALDTAASAIQLMEEICAAKLDPKLGKVRIMVVDDDVISRRAVAGSVQIIFGKPETADSGEAAVALAAEKPFDLVFMDVRMPGMDGFIACSKIHETGVNSATPVVFVTGQTDSAARKQATLCGGEGFITKPILASEISLTALTFALRGELRKLKGVEEEALV